MGIKGGGKSVVVEKVGQELLDAAWTILDLNGAPNLESAYWVVNKDCRSAYLQQLEENKILRGAPHCNCHKQYPILLICPETKQFDQYSIDSYNGFVIKSRQWYLDYCRENEIYPIEFQNSMIGKKIETNKLPLIEVKYLPEPSLNSSNHVAFKNLMTDAILHCRDQGRVLVFNPMLWQREFAKFKALELIIKMLEEVKNQHFLPQPPEIVNPIKAKVRAGSRISKEEKRLLSWQHMGVLIREASDLTAGVLKVETHSTLTKKALLGFIRRSRHIGCTLVLDTQRPDDVFVGIRDSFSIVLPRMEFEEEQLTN